MDHPHPAKPASLRIIQSLLHMEDENVRLRRARSPLHLLVVEDDLVSQHLLGAFFADRYCVFFCSNGAEAVNEYMRIMPDLTFLDLHLQGEYNGMDVLHTIRGHDANAKIVMISSDDSRRHILQAQQEGACGYLTKPFSKEPLLQYVQECEAAKSGVFVKGAGTWN